MGDDERLAKIEGHLYEISRDIGGIKQFMETSGKQTNELFDRIRDIEAHGCANMPDHERITALVEQHDKTLNQVTGAWVATGAIGAILGTIGGWILSMFSSKS